MPSDPRQRPAYLQLVAISWNFGWPVAAGVALGYWLDEKLGSSPWITLLLGLGSMWASILRLLQLSRQESEERRREEAEVAREDAATGPDDER